MQTREQTAPGPRGYPFVGALPALARDPLRFLMGVTRDYGNVVRLGRMGKQALYFISHPDDIRHVCLTRHRNFGKGLNNGTLDLLGRDAMALLDGDAWAMRRRILQPVFRGRQLTSYVPPMNEVLIQAFARWDATLTSDILVDVQQEMMRLSLDLIATTLFSTDVNLDDPSLRLAVHEVLNYIGARMWSPINIPAAVPTPSNVRFNAARYTIDETIYRIIAAHRAATTGRDDILARMLAARDEETGASLTDVQLHDELMSFFIAGHETTATLLTWVWYVLSKHPAFARALQYEVQAVTQGRPVQAKHLDDLRATRRVVEETLRLYPPGWAMGRRCVDDDVLGGFDIPAGSMVMFSPYVTHRRADLWPNPEGFDPDRFVEGVGDARPRFAYMPFGAGPFSCIAAAFAMQEAVLVVAATLQRYDWQLVPGQQVQPHPAFALRPRTPILMTLRRR